MKRYLVFIFLFVFASAQLFAAPFPNPKKLNYEGKKPKYVFLFIGDGTSYPQITSAMNYLGLENNSKYPLTKKLSFSDFPVVGSANTYDSSSYITDSASAATAYATGYKTLNGIISMDESKKTAYETIVQKIKKQRPGTKVGIISTVPLNHATPAAFYAHVPHRNDFYDISAQALGSGVDFFGGGHFIEPKGKKNDLKEITDVLKMEYKIVNTKNEILKLKANEGPVIALSPLVQYKGWSGGTAMKYAIDRSKDELGLADFVRVGINMLDNEEGFFMMAEGGKIDWSCHANDAATAIHEVIDLSEAVAEAVKFYKKHPEDTLIIVTGDHETGGMAIGYAGTKYSTYLDNISGQHLSWEEYEKVVAGYRDNKESFDNVKKDMNKFFGLKSFTDDELKKLELAYERSMIEPAQRPKATEDFLLYGDFEPLSVTVLHILANKSGIGWTSYAHSGLPVPVYAMGAGQELFNGYYDNTDVNFMLRLLFDVK